MITKQKSTTYTTEDGKTFDTIGEAQNYALAAMIGQISAATTSVDVAAVLLANRDKVLAILSATGRKPRARKGAKKVKTQPATP